MPSAKLTRTFSRRAMARSKHSSLTFGAVLRTRRKIGSRLSMLVMLVFETLTLHRPVHTETLSNEYHAEPSPVPLSIVSIFQNAIMLLQFGFD